MCKIRVLSFKYALFSDINLLNLKKKKLFFIQNGQKTFSTFAGGLDTKQFCICAFTLLKY